jgi:hypothetical protein
MRFMHWTPKRGLIVEPYYAGQQCWLFVPGYKVHATRSPAEHTDQHIHPHLFVNPFASIHAPSADDRRLATKAIGSPMIGCTNERDGTVKKRDEAVGT